MPRSSLFHPNDGTRQTRAATLLLAAGLVFVAGSGSASAARAAFSGAIVFERDAGPGSDIYVSTAPRTATPLVTTAAQEFDPAISSDGKVAFARAKGDQSEIYVLASGKETRVTHDGAVDQHTSWSPSGDHIAYSRDYGKGADIVEVRVGDPSSARAIAPAPGDDFTPAYSPDNRIVFASNRSGGFDLYVVDAKRRRLTRLTRDPDTELSPRWSPDGTRIAFTRVDKTGNADIWMLTLATRKLTRLTKSPADDSDPSFSPDGSQIAFVSDRLGVVPAIWTMPVKPGAAATLVSPSGVLSQGPVWGPKAPAPGKLQQRIPARAAISITCPDAGTPYGGSAGPDTIDGTDAADDTICGREGDDTVRGHNGHDTLSGGSNKDIVDGGNGTASDTGDPIVSGGPNSYDKIYGRAGEDKLYARDSRRDYLYGGTEYDRCQYDPPILNPDGTKTVIDVRDSCNATIA